MAETLPAPVPNIDLQRREAREKFARREFFMDKKYQVIRDPTDPRLHAPNKVIKNPQDPKIMMLTETLIGHHIIEGGLGLAAPQIGWNARVAVIQPPDWGGKIFVVYNPKIIGAREFLPDEKGENIAWDTEGCISHPGVVAEVARVRSLEFLASTYSDPKPKVRHAEGWFARILQHEVDHLNGILFTDKTYIRNLQPYMMGQQQQMDEHARNQEHGYADVESDG